LFSYILALKSYVKEPTLPLIYFDLLKIHFVNNASTLINFNCINIHLINNRNANNNKTRAKNTFAIKNANGMIKKFILIII